MSRVALACAGLLTTLLLQATLIGPLTFPAPVSLPVLMIVVVGIYAGPGVGLGLGFATGLLADLGSDHPAGVQALCWMTAGLVAGMVGGLTIQRGWRSRGIAAIAAGLAALTSALVTVMLAILGSHGASVWLAVRDLAPVGLSDALLGLVLVPAVRGLLRSQGIRAPRPAVDVIGRAHVSP
jgi:rod shape-determining protein MreD